MFQQGQNDFQCENACNALRPIAAYAGKKKFGPNKLYVKCFCMW